MPIYSVIAGPLMDLTREEVEFEWSDKCQLVFDMLKYTLTSTTMGICVLDYPRYETPLILETDAGLKGLGAVLSHKYD